MVLGMICMSTVSAICRYTAAQQAWRTPMGRREVGLIAVAAVFACAALPAAAQQKSLKEQVIGTWQIVSVVEFYPEGRKETPWGPNIKGAVSFDPHGKVLLMIIGADLPNPSGKPQEAPGWWSPTSARTAWMKGPRPSPTPPS